MLVQRLSLTVAAVSAFLCAYGQTTLAESSLCDEAVIMAGDNTTIPYLCDKNDRTAFTAEAPEGISVTLKVQRPWMLKGINIVASESKTQFPASCSLYARANSTDEWTKVYDYSKLTISGPYTSFLHKVPGRFKTAATEFRLDFSAPVEGSTLSIADLQLLGYPVDDPSNLANENNSQFTSSAADNATLDFNFENPVTLSAYALTPGQTGASASRPASWEFLASEDGQNWVTLDWRSNNSNLAVDSYQERYTLPSSGTVVNYGDEAERVLKVMLNNFYRDYGSGKYLIHAWHENPDKEGRSFDYWWQAHAVDACVDAYLRTGNRVWGNRAAQLKLGMYTAYDPNRLDLWNSFYDDMEWMCIACCRAAEFLPSGNSVWLSEAKKLFNWIWGGWNDVDGGGIGWNCDNGKNSKNSCSNAPAMIAAARLYKLTGDQDYLDKAIKIHDWMLTHSRFDDGFIKDSPHNEDCGWTFSYNQGTWVGGLLELYKITGDEKYRQTAVELMDKCLFGQWYSPHGIMREQGDGDGGLFKGIYIRYIAQWVLSGKLDPERQFRYAKYLTENAKSLYLTSLIKPDMKVMPCWCSRDKNYNGSVNGSADGTYHSSILLSGVFLLESVDRMRREGLLNEDYSVKNPAIGKPYSHYRIHFTSNRGASDIKLGNWALYAAGSAGLTQVTASRKTGVISSGAGNIQVSGIDPGTEIRIFAPTGRQEAALTASATDTSISLNPGIYVVTLSDGTAAKAIVR